MLITLVTIVIYRGWGAGMAQWWERSPPTNVARVRFRLGAEPYVGWVCCWFSSLLWGFFSGYTDFPPNSKTNISKFQFDLGSEGHRFVSGEAVKLNVTLVKQSRFIYLFILIVTILRENSYVVCCHLCASYGWQLLILVTMGTQTYRPREPLR